MIIMNLYNILVLHRPWNVLCEGKIRFPESCFVIELQELDEGKVIMGFMRAAKRLRI